jgi:diaminopimelate decarboxylase
MSSPRTIIEGRPPGFVYREPKSRASRLAAGSLLYCEDVSVAKLAGQFGTPLYIYSGKAVRERLQAFQKAFRGVPHTLCYSVKANSNLALLRLVAKQGCGFDVVSGGELERVLLADRRAAKRVVFSGVGKTREELRAALRAEILLFNVESESELSALAECAAALRKTARIALRVNPDVAADTHPYISTGLRQHKFGVPILEARALYAKAAAAQYLKVAGVSVHIGSQITDVAPFAESATRIAELVRQLRLDKHSIEYVDVGGGLGISYDKPDRSDFSEYVASYARAAATPLRNLKVHLLLEPGRSVVGAAGALITSVVYRKTNNGKVFLVVDAGMNDLIRPSLYGAHHEIVPVNRAKAASLETVDVVGPVCETGDFFARDRELPVVQEGELLAILDAGAYGMVLASNYNTRPRPAEILVNGKSATVARRRETVHDLLRQEVLSKKPRTQ